MRRRHDDLQAWRDDPLVQALTAPGTAEELADEQRALDTFRSAGPRRLRMLHRLGAGGTALSIALVASGGVAAAAYSRALPAPLQQAASTVFGWAAVPAPPPAARRIASGNHAHLAARARPAGSAPAVVSPPAVTPAATPTKRTGPKTAHRKPHGAAPAARRAGTNSPGVTSSPSAV